MGGSLEIKGATFLFSHAVIPAANKVSLNSGDLEFKEKSDGHESRTEKNRNTVSE